MNEYFNPPTMCQSKGGALNFVCQFHAVSTGRRSVCLYRHRWEYINYNFKCHNKEWQTKRIEPWGLNNGEDNNRD